MEEKEDLEKDTNEDLVDIRCSNCGHIEESIYGNAAMRKCVICGGQMWFY